MKYKNISLHTKHVKVDGKFVSVKPGNVFDCPVKVHDPEIQLVVEKKEVSEKAKPKQKKLSEKELKSLTKDGLNDYAAKLGYLEINTDMLKAEMIEKILKFQG